MAGTEPYPKLPRPACEGLSRAETTDLLNSELVRLRLTRRNAYSYWAHEVEFSNHLYGGGMQRVDFVQFEPYGYHTCTDAAAVERGTFSFYEVKSSMEDIMSGHGLNFMGDENWVVMPVEVYEKYKEASLRHDWLRDATHDAGCLLYGTKRNGRAGFVEAGKPYLIERIVRKRPASEILLCMMRAMLANSGHSNVNHVVRGLNDDRDR